MNRHRAALIKYGCLLSAVMISTSVNGSDPDLLKNVNWKVATIQSFFNDQVVDGCLPRPDSVNNQLEAELRKSGFRYKPTSEEFPTIYFRVDAFGGGKSNCVVSLNVSVSTLASVTRTYGGVNMDSELGVIELWDHQGVLTGSDMQSRIEDEMSDIVRDFYLATQRAKDE